MRHPHADLIHAWAEGAEIEMFTILGDEWVVTDTPTWDERLTYRIKQEPKWYENIPAHGVLCWVKDYEEQEPSLVLVTGYGKMHESMGKFKNNRGAWCCAEPLTNEEIKQFLRGGQ